MRCQFTFRYNTRTDFWLCNLQKSSFVPVCSSGVFGDSVSVMEGDYVTLNTGVTKIHEDEDILWKFGADKSLIAQIKREEQIFPDERFRDRLKLDRQTGSLTITNIKSEQAGLYEVKISGAKRSTKTFTVSVYGE